MNVALFAAVNRKIGIFFFRSQANVFRLKTQGDAGDEEEMYPKATRHHKDVRVHVRYTCEKCSTMFKDHEKTCGKCGHERCNGCTRQPPKKENALDPAAVERIEKRMREMELSPQAEAT